MPIYEYYSPDTNKIYKFFAKTLAQKDVIPKCPDGEEHRMEKMLSGFAITGKTRKSKKDDDPGERKLPDVTKKDASIFD